MGAWQPILLYEGEDEAKLKAEFVELCAKHKNTFSYEEVALHVFRDLPDPTMRALQAAAYWGKDLEVIDAIRQRILVGADDIDTSDVSLKRRLLALADDTRVPYKDRIEAITKIAQMQGMITKPIEIKTPGKGKVGLAGFKFEIDYDADKPPEVEEVE